MFFRSNRHICCFQLNSSSITTHQEGVSCTCRSCLEDHWSWGDDYYHQPNVSHDAAAGLLWIEGYDWSALPCHWTWFEIIFWSGFTVMGLKLIEHYVLWWTQFTTLVFAIMTNRVAWDELSCMYFSGYFISLVDITVVNNFFCQCYGQSRDGHYTTNQFYTKG